MSAGCGFLNSNTQRQWRQPKILGLQHLVPVQFSAMYLNQDVGLTWPDPLSKFSGWIWHITRYYKLKDRSRLSLGISICDTSATLSLNGCTLLATNTDLKTPRDNDTASRELNSKRALGAVWQSDCDPVHSSSQPTGFKKRFAKMGLSPCEIDNASSRRLLNTTRNNTTFCNTFVQPR